MLERAPETTHALLAPGPGWVKLTDVGGPGDKGERYRLYRLVK